jgi:hypothetical protein
MCGSHTRDELNIRFAWRVAFLSLALLLSAAGTQGISWSLQARGLLAQATAAIKELINPLPSPPAQFSNLTALCEVANSFEPSHYKAPFWARNPHVMTISASGDLEKMIRGDRLRDLPYWRERWTTPDGDWIDIDWCVSSNGSSEDSSSAEQDGTESNTAASADGFIVDSSSTDASTSANMCAAESTTSPAAHSYSAADAVPTAAVGSSSSSSSTGNMGGLKLPQFKLPPNIAAALSEKLSEAQAIAETLLSMGGLGLGAVPPVAPELGTTASGTLRFYKVSHFEVCLCEVQSQGSLANVLCSCLNYCMHIQHAAAREYTYTVSDCW